MRSPEGPARGATTRGAKMAIYYLDIKTGSRSSGQSARAKCHYILRHGRYAPRPGQSTEVLHATSGHMPSWAEDRPADFWAAADLHERANARLFKELVVALPIELGLDEQRALADQFAETVTTHTDPATGETERLPFTLALHAGHNTNPHFHLVFTERVNDDLERPAEQWFRRHNAKVPERGGARKTRRLKPTSWLEETREAWATVANSALEAAGHDARIDHRTLAEQGIDRVPGVHLGPIRHMEARGFQTQFISRAVDDFDAAERDLRGEAELQAAAEAGAREAAAVQATADREAAAMREAAARQAEAAAERQAKVAEVARQEREAEAKRQQAAAERAAEVARQERQAEAERAAAIERAEREAKAERQAKAAEAEIAAAAEAAALRAVKSGTHLPKPEPGTWRPGSAPEDLRRETWERDRAWLTHDWWRAAGRAVWETLIRPTAERIRGTAAAPAPDPTPVASTAPAAPSPIGAAAAKAKTEPAPAPLRPREALAFLLAKHGVQKFKARYEGIGDDGGVFNVDLHPSGCLPERYLQPVQALVWKIAHAEHPKFEEGAGGHGTLAWSHGGEIEITHVVGLDDTAAPVAADAEADSDAPQEDADDSPSPF